MTDEQEIPSRASTIGAAILNAIPITVALGAYGSLIYFAAMSWHRDHVPSGDANDAIALWTMWTAIGQIFAGITALGAAIFAAGAYTEGRRTRVATELQAKEAEKQTIIARDEADAAHLREIKREEARLAERKEMTLRSQTERDERAAANRAILIIEEVRFRRGNSHGPIFEATVKVKNVGGSTALAVKSWMSVRFELPSDSSRHYVTSDATKINALPALREESLTLETACNAINPCLPEDVYHDVINGQLRLEIDLFIEWRDVHGYSISHTFEQSEMLDPKSYICMTEPELVHERISNGDRIVFEADE